MIDPLCLLGCKGAASIWSGRGRQLRHSPLRLYCFAHYAQFTDCHGRWSKADHGPSFSASAAKLQHLDHAPLSILTHPFGGVAVRLFDDPTLGSSSNQTAQLSSPGLIGLLGRPNRC